jgi:putative FmdB family regulatory protein
MPIYEYACADCDREFELLVNTGDVAECPSCHSRKLDKRLSLPARPREGRAITPCSAPADVPPCGPV